MARDWETWLKNSIGPASATEETDRDRTEKRIRDAILRDTRLAGNVRIFVKGSYANSTNVRADSDVDIAVEWKDWAYLSKVNKAAALSWDQLGVPLGDSDPSPRQYRGWVEEALIDVFGASCVDTTGNKAITVTRGQTTLDADVVPCFRLKRYDGPGREPHLGTRLYPKNGGSVENWPDQHLANGIAKNSNTGRRYKQIIRALKRLENDMVKTGRLSQEVHGYFLECLLYNLSDTAFMRTTYTASSMAVLAEMWQDIDKGRHTDWLEVNRLEWLWRNAQTWTPDEASKFAYEAWNYMNGS
jgi:predicted nucleotidyltransferase